MKDRYKNQDKYRAKRKRVARKRKDRWALIINDFKKDGCNVCGYRKCISALEFHHIEGNKEGAISSMLQASGLMKILKEIEKCIVVCANCHREIHSGLVVKTVMKINTYDSSPIQPCLFN